MAFLNHPNRCRRYDALTSLQSSSSQTSFLNVGFDFQNKMRFLRMTDLSFLQTFKSSFFFLCHSFCPLLSFSFFPFVLSDFFMLALPHNYLSFYHPHIQWIGQEGGILWLCYCMICVIGLGIFDFKWEGENRSSSFLAYFLFVVHFLLSFSFFIFLFLNGPSSASFSLIIGLFKQTIQILQQINVKICPLTTNLSKYLKNHEGLSKWPIFTKFGYTAAILHHKLVYDQS